MRRTTGPVISYPLYLAGLATMLCALAALNAVLSDISFTILTGVLMCIGYATSLILRRIGYITRLVELIVITAAVLIYIQIIGGRVVSDLLIPLNTANSPELKLASMLLWLEVLRSFTLVSDEAVVFSAIPAVVLISLTATNNVNSELMSIFIMYLVLASFMLAHRPEGNGQSIKPGFRMAIVITCLSLALGCIAVIPIKMTCRKAFTAALPQFTRLRERASMSDYADSSVLQISQGPVRLSDKVVMSIRSHSLKTGDSLGTYWRGKVFDRYTGHGWQSSSHYEEMTREWIDAPEDKNGWSRYTVQIPDHGELIEQIIYPKLILGRDVIAATEPAVIEGPFSELRRNEFNCWRSFPSIGGMAGYRVVSAMPVMDHVRLRKASTNYDDATKIYFLQTTTGTAKAGKLARYITRRINNPYDKALAIKNYLGEHYIYDLNAPPAPSGKDAVDHFLFTSKIGYCDVFASAMVVMCRETGVPARLVTGYATGDYDSDADRFNVRDKDRHAWAEVYFPDCGWVTFDPTELTRERSESLIGRISASFRRMISGMMSGSITLPLLFALLIVGAGIAFAPDFIRLRMSGRSAGPSKLHSVLVARYESILRSLKVKNKHLTPCEAAAAGTEDSPSAISIALEAAKLFGDIRYSGRDVTTRDVRELERLHKELKSALRR